MRPRTTTGACLAVLLVAGCSRTEIEGGPGFLEEQCKLQAPCVRSGVYPGPCTEIHDTDLDGQPDQCSSYQYDDRCLLVHATHDFGCDGVLDVDESFTHDERGLRVEETRLYQPDWVERWSYTYDAHEHLLLVQADHGADTEIDYWIEYERDPHSRTVTERSYSHGELTSVTATVRDERDRILLVEEHQYFCVDETVFTADVVARRTNYVYDDTSHVMALTIDGVDCHVADGVVDVRIQRRFDGNGHLLSELMDGQTSTPGPPDGIDDSCSYFTYDDHGRLVRLEKDGGSVSGEVAFCDGVIDYAAVHVYDRTGREIRLEQDVDADGTADLATQFYHDPCGNPTGWQGVQMPTGDVLWRHELDYACWL